MRLVGTLILLGLTLDLGQARAQATLDPSSATLLRGSSSPEPDDLDSDRFTVTPQSNPTPPPTPKRKPRTDAPPIAVKAPAAPVPVAPAPPPAAAANAPLQKPSLGEQMKVLILGGNSEDIEEFKSKIHPDDRRNNIVEISMAPSYFCNGSTSNYSIRNFTSQGPAINAERPQSG